MIQLKGKYANPIIYIDSVEDGLIGDILEVANHPAFNDSIRIMPDVHRGMGSVIGFTMELGSKIIPNTIGVDIGCGVLASNIGKNIVFDHEMLDRQIRNKIPFGVKKRKQSLNYQYDYLFANKQLAHFVNTFNNKFETNYNTQSYSPLWFENKCKQIGTIYSDVDLSLGTLGGGNHFIEIGKSILKNGIPEYWIIIHSGSRNFGKRICDYWQKKAKKTIIDDKRKEFDNAFNLVKDTIIDKSQLEKIRKKMKEELEIDNVASGLEYLEGENAFNYLVDMLFAQFFANFNRFAMLEQIKQILGITNIRYTVNSVHNYVDFQDMIIRKGAIRSYKNEQLIIPLNMRDGSLLAIGKSNSDWNYSAPHGAGRTMSRTMAKKKLDMEEFTHTMKGIYSKSVRERNLDESPMAYKDGQIIEDTIEPTAQIVMKILPIHNLKD